MKHSKWELKRRDFLKTLGVGAAMMPLLSETTATAVSTSSNSRLLIVTKGNGVQPETFWPTWSGGRPASGALSSAIFPHVTAPLDAYREKLLFLDGLTLRNWLANEGNTTGDNGDAHHNWASLFTGELPSDRLLTDGGCHLNSSPPGCRMQAGSVSLDCYVGQRLKEQDSTLAFDSLHVSLNADDIGSARGQGGFNCPSWFDRDQPNPAEPDPMVVFTKLFAGAQQLPQAQGPDPKLRDRLRLLDFVGKDIERFSKRLGTEDRQLTQAHLESVRRRQEQLDRIVNNKLECKVPPAPTVEYRNRQEEHIPELSRVMIDMTIDAMKCGLTRTACYSLYDSNSYWAYFSWLKNINPNFGNQSTLSISEFPEAHFHSMAHGKESDPGMTMYRDANRWLMEQYAYVLERLSAETELGGSMLDNTLVLWADSLADGHGHTVMRMPWILAGNANGYFRSGRHVSLPADTATNGLFVSIAEAMGVAPESGTFGNAQFGQGALTSLT